MKVIKIDGGECDFCHRESVQAKYMFVKWFGLVKDRACKECHDYVMMLRSIGG